MGPRGAGPVELHRAHGDQRTAGGLLRGRLGKHAKDDGVFDVTAADLDTALAGILDLRDTPGTSTIDPNAHGSGFDRVSAFQDGYDNGLDKCKDYRDDEPMVLELPFSSAADEARGRRRALRLDRQRRSL